jgi:hypothetical protein
MAAAAGEHHALDPSAADQARFAFAAIDPVLELEETFFAVGVNVVGD